MKRLQKGTTSIEFAIIGGLAMLVMLGVIELSRLMFVMNAMNESTRRGARVAVVCTIGDPAIARAAVFNSGGGDQSPIIRGLSTDNINVRYLDESGAPITGESQGVPIRVARPVVVSAVKSCEPLAAMP